MTETTNERLVLVRWLAVFFSRAMVHKHKQTDQLPNTVSLHSSSSSVTVNIKIRELNMKTRCAAYVNNSVCYQLIVLLIYGDELVPF